MALEAPLRRTVVRELVLVWTVSPGLDGFAGRRIAPGECIPSQGARDTGKHSPKAKSRGSSEDDVYSLSNFQRPQGDSSLEPLWNLVFLDGARVQRGS